MKKSFKEKLNLPLRIGMICFSIIVIVLIINIFSQRMSEKQPQVEPIVENDSDFISIPGYEMLELIADTKVQALCMPNPSQNSCYFQLNLYLSDGTLIWQSELIEPGLNSKPMVLLHSLNKGVYFNAILRYSCYSMDDTLTPLNGAETKLTLNVK
jgi:hypothetical protein